MGWDYAYGTRFDSEGSPTAFGTAVASVRIPQETSPGLKTQPVSLANTHGLHAATRGYYQGYSFVLEVDLSYGSPETAANVYANRSTVLRRLLNNEERVWLTRTAPDQGAVELPILVLRSVQTGTPRHRLVVPCQALDPFWRTQAVSFSAVDPTAGVTVAGDAPINDAVLVFSGMNGVQRLTHTTSGDYIELNTNTVTNAVTVDVGAKTIKQLGAHLDGTDTISSPEWLELVPGSNAFTLSGTGSVTLTARNKYL